MSGALVLVATPIGNLGDLSPRAAATLAEVDLIAAEDTRRTRALLSAAGIPAGGRLLSLRAANEEEMARHLVERLAGGGRAAYVTDAGTPGISDPGERLVRACLEAGIEVSAVPGPSALLVALVLSGLPCDRFVFEGFLPRRGGERARRLAVLAAKPRTVVLYEAPHRLAATLEDLARVVGPERRVALARELTKRFEEVWRGTVGEARSRPEPRGEYVVVLEGAPPPPAPGPEAVERVLRDELAAGESVRDAARSAARRLGVSRRDAYEAARTLAPRRPPADPGTDGGVTPR